MSVTEHRDAVGAVRESFERVAAAEAALDAARAARTETVREHYPSITAVGWTRFARAVGVDAHGDALVHESTLRTLTADLRVAERARRARKPK